MATSTNTAFAVNVSIAFMAIFGLALLGTAIWSTAAAVCKEDATSSWESEQHNSLYDSQREGSSSTHCDSTDTFSEDLVYYGSFFLAIGFGVWVFVVAIIAGYNYT